MMKGDKVILWYSGEIEKFVANFLKGVRQTYGEFQLEESKLINGFVDKLRVMDGLFDFSTDERLTPLLEYYTLTMEHPIQSGNIDGLIESIYVMIEILPMKLWCLNRRNRR